MTTAATLGLVALLTIGTTGAGCRRGATERSTTKSVEDVSPSSSTSESAATACVRLPTGASLVGANVIDLPDDKDQDRTNDGARGYGSDAANQTLTKLSTLGLNAVLLPVVLTADDVGGSKIESDAILHGEARRLTKMIQQAHTLHQRVVLVPHLRLRNGAWRGDLNPPSLPAFFKAYGDVVERIAAIAEVQCVEGLSIGIEFKALSRRADAEPHFRTLIKRLRKTFHGELLYSANWDEAEHVRFWDALDRMGVNAFFPLSKAPNPDDKVLHDVAASIVTAMDAYAAKIGKRWWVTELGFKATPASYVEPWKWPGEVGARALAVDEESQARGYRAWFAALASATAIDGVFFWMVPSDLNDVEHPWAFEPRQGFSFLGKEVESEVATFATTWTQGRVPE